MDRASLINRIDALSESLLLADTSDLDTFAHAHEDFSNFARWAEAEGLHGPAEALQATCSIIEQIILHEAADPAGAIDVVNRCLSAFQTLVRDDRPADEVPFPQELVRADDSPQSPSQPVNNPVSDQHLLSEFLAHAESVLAEIEPLIVSVEARPSERAVAQIRREVHTLKAEAAFVGLGQISAVLHIVEDAIDRLDGVSLPENMLDVVDWLRRCVVARKASSPDPEYPETIIEALKGVAKPNTPAPVRPQPKPGRRLEADVDLLREFVVEAREHLDNADVHLLSVETNPGDKDALDSIFRAFHTIKGVAGFLGLDEVQSLAHEAENLLDKARKRELELRGTYIDVTFDAADMMKALFNNVERALGTGGVLDYTDGLDEVVSRVRAARAGKVAPQLVKAAPVSISQKPIGEILEDSGVASHAAVESALAAQARAEALPIGELLVREVVISRSQLEKALKIQESEGFTRKLGEILVSAGMARTEDITRAIGKQQHPMPEPLGAVLVRAGETSAKDVAQALRTQRQQTAPIEIKEAVKVDAERLDTLIDLIGELVIAESMVSQSQELTRSVSQQLNRQMSQLDKITRELQEIGTSLRMVPVRATFQKMSRLVRDLSKKSGKSVEFVTEGEDTELDKTVVDKIGDPLVHMVRNAVDHGIEASAADRIRAGKPESARVTLRAFHKSGSIYIQIEDDGRGLDREAILAKARERGLVRDGDTLTDRDVFGLIFEPGFSTAKQVTDVSGRGVGMDVVRRNIESLRGQIEIQSEPGKGSLFNVRLPLTLAIIDGMVVRVGKERYVVPTLSVLRSIKPEAGQLATVVDRGEMLTIQGQLIPLFRLYDLFMIDEATTDPLNAIVLILEDEGKLVGLMVDELLGQQQIVIKSLGEAMKNVRGVAGGAIMGDGTVGLIVDVNGIVRLAQEGAESPGPHPRKTAA